jgi:hypothetical protein
MILLGRLTKIATVHPMTKGMLAINPQRRDSNMVCDGIAASHLSYPYFIFY